MPPETVLLVDDDANLLAAARRNLGRQFHIVTAESGLEALKLLQEQGSAAVVISDMQMPGMDGVALCSAIKAAHPDTVCIMLTGNADLDTAMKAVNEGRIFRFMTKPCPREALALTITAGLEQSRLILAERELLQKTLTGSIRVLTEILSLVNPAAFQRAMRLREHVRHLVAALQFPSAWQYEIAAMVSQLGCVILPPDVMEKFALGRQLTPTEAQMVAGHPAVGKSLLAPIPRLEAIARMVELQAEPYDPMAPQDPATREGAVVWGAALLRFTQDIDALQARGMSRDACVHWLAQRAAQYPARLVQVFSQNPFGDSAGKPRGKVRQVTVGDLKVGMIAVEDIMASNGLLVVPRGQEINETLILRLHNFNHGVGIREPFQVHSLGMDAAK